MLILLGELGWDLILQTEGFLLILFQVSALSSVVEHYLHTVGVVGSKPTVRTIIFIGES